MRFSSLMTSVVLVAAILGVTLTSTGCPSDEATCSDYNPAAGFDPSTPVISFKTQVFPIFKFSCAFSSCHGSLGGSNNGVFLGGDDAVAVRAGLVDKPADELPAMAFVKPGAPHDSYLMRKLDGSQCVLDAQCKDGSCGDSMPHNDSKLDLDKRDTVRRWIAQGAQEN